MFILQESPAGNYAFALNFFVQTSQPAAMIGIPLDPGG